MDRVEEDVCNGFSVKGPTEGTELGLFLKTRILTSFCPPLIELTIGVVNDEDTEIERVTSVH